jgi:hypothetical protein
MWKRVLLLLWLLGILLPMAWFTRYSPLYGRAFALLFGPLWVHIAMHALLFAVLAYLAGGELRRRVPAWPLRGHALLVLGLLLAVALFQEAIQLSYKARPAGPDELLDLAVDLAGGAAGFLATRRPPTVPPERRRCARNRR